MKTQPHMIRVIAVLAAISFSSGLCHSSPGDSSQGRILCLWTYGEASGGAAEIDGEVVNLGGGGRWVVRSAQTDSFGHLVSAVLQEMGSDRLVSVPVSGGNIKELPPPPPRRVNVGTLPEVIMDESLELAERAADYASKKLRGQLLEDVEGDVINELDTKKSILVPVYTTVRFLTSGDGGLSWAPVHSIGKSIQTGEAVVPSGGGGLPVNETIDVYYSGEGILLGKDLDFDNPDALVLR